MSKIDWSKAGKRIRWQPRRPDGSNPDWNFTAQRWKDEADYYADELDLSGVIAHADCPVANCGAKRHQACRGISLSSYHQPRRRAAGEALLELKGPRFTKGQTG